MVAIPINDVAIISIVTILHIVAIVFTIKIGGIFNLKSWMLIIVAFVLLLFRRIMSFLDLFEIVSYNELIVIIDRIYLPLVVWVLIGLGMIKIYYNIKSSMHLERRLKNVVKKSIKK